YLASTANHHFSDAVERGLPGTDNCFEVCWDEYAYSLSMMDHLFMIPQKMGWTPPNKKIAMVKVDLPYCVDPADRFRELAEPKGYEFVIDEITQFGKVDWGSILTKIERAKPSYILLFLLDPTDSARFQTQFHDRFGKKGLPAIINYQYTPMIPEFLELTGKEAAEGIVYMGVAIREQDPVVQDYLKRWDAKFHERPLDGYAVMTRDSFDVWATAVKKVGCVECYDQIIRKIRGSLNRGMWGTYVFAPHDQTAIYGEELIPVDWMQIRDGKHLQTFPDQWKMTEYQKPPWIK
ncbi:MAG: ABC transporter substrate-binding protein, partial [Deltaproteobacteria bacterium]|nr:ABC transporter substrate-binding protein [Deltaproteobacteria bacterium]